MLHLGLSSDSFFKRTLIVCFCLLVLLHFQFVCIPFPGRYRILINLYFAGVRDARALNFQCPVISRR